MSSIPTKSKEPTVTPNETGQLTLQLFEVVYSCNVAGKLTLLCLELGAQ
jgi:hypothetical protein